MRTALSPRIPALALAALLMLAAADSEAEAGGDILIVTNLNDSGTGSLRDTITGAGRYDEIFFEAGVTGTLILTGGPLTLAEHMSITGPDSPGVTIDGNGNGAVFHITALASLSAYKLTVTNGSNTAGGGFLNLGELRIYNSTIRNNASSGEGGGILNIGTLLLVNSTVSGNTAFAGAGIANWPGFTATLKNSTISNNSATDHAGGIHNDGGTVSLSNTIVAGNTAPTGPDCTGSPSSTGYSLVGIDDGCTVTTSTGDIVGTAASPVDARLRALADNGGPTGTHALLPNSPALDAGNPATPTGGGACEPTDQRGVARPLGAACDIGAYEADPATLVPALSGLALAALAAALAGLVYLARGRRAAAVRA